MAIVEGHGDGLAVPILIQRIAQAHQSGLVVEVPPPIRVPKTKLLKAGELERTIEFAARRTSANDGILVLLDADDDCPGTLGPELLRRAQAKRPDRRTRVVAANREYEAWFLAAASSIAGARGLAANLVAPSDPEAVSDAKGWLSHRSGSGRRYRATLDQPALTELFDIQAARRARSFDKLWRDLVSLF